MNACTGEEKDGVSRSMPADQLDIIAWSSDTQSSTYYAAQELIVSRIAPRPTSS
jgi:hypothetical protein